MKPPVFLARCQDEPTDQKLQEFSRRLWQAINSSDLKDGTWQLCERDGWPDNGNYRNLVAWCCRKGEEHHLIVVNLSESRSQARVRIPWEDVAGRSWRLTDELTEEVYDRDGTELCVPGLHMDLGPWEYHFLSF